MEKYLLSTLFLILKTVRLRKERQNIVNYYNNSLIINIATQYDNNRQIKKI